MALSPSSGRGSLRFITPVVFAGSPFLGIRDCCNDGQLAVSTTQGGIGAVPGHGSLNSQKHGKGRPGPGQG
jgi:hypothetical protein